MNAPFSYRGALARSEQISWRVEDLIGAGKSLDFAKPFLPESLARAETLAFLTPREQVVLNQIRGHGYLYMFGAVEEFILPFVMDHARNEIAAGDDYRNRALLEFAAEEAKHIHLFKRFRQEFLDGFGVDCEVIGPPEAIAKEILKHHPLAVTLAILGIEWMTQKHYTESVRDDGALDPQFKSLLKHHWMEEMQHAQLDTLMAEAYAARCREDEILAAVGEYLEIGAFLDGGLRQQTEFDLAAFERATGRTLAAAEREEFIARQHQAQRWTFLGSGLTHPQATATLERLSPEGARRIAEVAPAFC